MKALAIVGLLVLPLSAFGQKSAENLPGVLLHGGGQHGTLRMTVVDPNGEPAKHVGVQVFWLCLEACQIVVSSVLTNSAGELRFDPITVGKYLVCSSADTDSLRPCFIDASAPSCTVEITNENPKVELRMQIPKHGTTPPETHDKALCRLTASSSH